MTKTTKKLLPAEQLALDVRNAGNRHGPNEVRQKVILDLCTLALDEAHGRGYMAGVEHEGKQ